MKRLLAVLAFLMPFSSAVFATAQIPETLIMDGSGRSLFTNPLDPWLRVDSNADKLKPYISVQRCSASWRGYAGTWEIDKDRLMLVKLKADPCNQKSTEIPLSALFPGQSGSVIATWFSGRLTVPDGKQIQYVHMGYMSKYERYILLQIELGIVVHRQVVTELPSEGHDSIQFPRANAPPPPRIVP
jgi:hypothetical protein